MKESIYFIYETNSIKQQTIQWKCKKKNKNWEYTDFKLLLSGKLSAYLYAGILIEVAFFSFNLF